MKKIQSILLVIIILINLGSYTEVYGYESNPTIENQSYTSEPKNENISDKPKYETDLENFKESTTSNIENNENQAENKEYRLIVELKGEPVIAEAVKRGITYSQLDESVIEAASKKIENEQEQVFSDIVNQLQESESTDRKANLSEISPNIKENKEILRYDTNFNGFVIKGNKADIDEIKQNPKVKNVFISQEFERPQLRHSTQTIGANYAWDTLNYKGEGMVVAIIDTGVDYTHEAMHLSAGVVPKYTEQSINQLIAEQGLKGKYYTAKVPYGYNYYDHNDNTLDSYGSMHGMHVAGITSANSDEIKGVAPEAQILALKVFSDDIQYPTTFTDVWLKAIDDAIKLKADVINMSLGAPAGLVNAEAQYDPQQEGIARAKKAGILIAISAGNEGQIMMGNRLKHKANIENPDTGLIASPSLYPDSFSVASSDNTVKYNTYLTYTNLSGKEKKHLINIVRGVSSPIQITGQVVDLENGEEHDYENKGNLENKIIMFRMNSEEVIAPYDDQDHDEHKNESTIKEEDAIRADESILEDKKKEILDNISESEDSIVAAVESEQILDPESIDQPKDSAGNQVELSVDENSNKQEKGDQEKVEEEKIEKVDQTKDKVEEAAEEVKDEAVKAEEKAEEAKAEVKAEEAKAEVEAKEAKEIKVEEVYKEEIENEILPQHDHDSHKKGMSLLEKIEFAKSKNPAAIIIYNNKDLGEYLGIPLSSAFPRSGKTMAVLGYKGITEIKKELTENKNLNITLSNQLQEEVNGKAGHISFFSSWGPTGDLKIKPEITAPGGNIYSTIEDNNYKSMSGTSMASPHVAGAALIMKQYLQKQNISNEEIVDRIKLLLMNTAVPLKDVNGNYSFVRQQGAGLMQLDKALKTKVTVTATSQADQIQDGKLELGELKSKNFSFNLKLNNASDKEKQYHAKAILIADKIEDGKLLAEPISKEYPLANNQIRLNPNENQTLSFDINFGNEDMFKANQFVEGFIILEDLNSNEDEKMDLSIPFLGFYGDWEVPKAIDAFNIKAINQNHDRKQQFKVQDGNESYSSMFITGYGLRVPVLDDTIYFSPHLETFKNKNYYPWVGVRLAILRNLDRMEYSILDTKTNKVLRVLGEDHNIRKLNRLAYKPSFVSFPESVWDGKINNQPAKDGGEYIYQIKAKVNVGEDIGNKEQYYRYKMKIDSSAPEVLNNQAINVERIDSSKRKLHFQIQDKISGLNNIYIQSVYFVKKNDEGEVVKASADEVGNNPDLTNYKTRYGNHIKIEFVNSKEQNQDREKAESFRIFKVKDGRLEIPDDYFDQHPDVNTIFCDTDRYYKDPLDVSLVFNGRYDYISVSANDQTLNVYEKFIRVDAEREDYNILFMNFYNSLRDFKAKIWVNDKPVEDIEYKAKGKSKIKIEFPEKNAKLERIYLDYEGKRDVLIENGELSEEMQEKYKAILKDFSLEFVLDKVLDHYTVITTIKEYVSDENYAEISFENVDFSKFENGEIIFVEDINTQKFKKITKQNPKLKYKKGEITLFADLKDAVDSLTISINANGNLTYLIPAFDNNDYSDHNNVYILNGKKIYIKFDLKANSIFKIDYPDSSSDPFFDDFYSDQSEHNNSKNGKYPIIILKTPKLLDVKTENDLVSGGLLVEGFVGYMKNSLKSLTLSLVDKFGNVNGESMQIPLDSIYQENVHFHSQNKEIYDGKAYVFNTYIKPKSFNTNLRIEAISNNQEKASIVRRLYFDNQFADLSYEVLDRSLSSENAMIKIKSKDNSFKINLYKDGSYIDGVDLSRKSFESNNAKIEKEIIVPLKLGQNKIEIKAVDLSKHESKKTIYIYRSEK